jgi:hypothetical protein
MPGRVVYKSQGVEWLDDYFDVDDNAALKDRYTEANNAIAELGEQDLLSDITPSLRPDDQYDHFREHWLSDGGALARQEVNRVMRHAYEEAIALANTDQARQIETFWVTGASDDFEIHLCEGRHSIMVFVFIPGIEGGSLNTRFRSWVVRVRAEPYDRDIEVLNDEGPAIVKLQLSGPGARLADSKTRP